MIGALRWITYINVSSTFSCLMLQAMANVMLLQPLKYGFESIVTNEFRTLDGSCSNLIPQGAGYENVSLTNQVCTTVGSLPAEDTVNGARFVLLSYGFKWSNTWMV